MSAPSSEASGHEQIQGRIRAIAEAVEARLSELIDARPAPSNLREAARYALFGGGKRLRPAMLVLSCEASGGGADDALTAAAAMEMVHTFSLVHDDLPAMDDDDLRRGRPTLHRHTNEAMAILTGDLLFGLAVESLRHEPRLVGELIVAANDMIAGQVYDTLPEFNEGLSELEKLRTVHRHKTGALIRAACRMGGFCADASEATIDRLTRYGEAAGLMFQVIDDILDVTQSTESLGKTAGKDANLGKRTYPALLGLEGAREHADTLHRQALAAIEPLGERAAGLQQLADFMAVRTR